MPGLNDNSLAALSQPAQSGTSSSGADLSVASFTSLPRIPCASVLVRIQVQTLPRSSGPSPSASSPPNAPIALSNAVPSARSFAPSIVSLDTKTLEAAIAPPPLYSDGFYDSTAATPAGSEISM